MEGWPDCTDGAYVVEQACHPDCQLLIAISTYLDLPIG